MAGLMTGDSTHAGLIEINGKTIQSQGKVAADIRTTRADSGFVFQQFNLVDRLPVIVNVLVGTLHRLPMWRSLVRWFSAAEVARGVEALRRVGIAECWAQRASTLSGGQQQRAAIARAMVQGAKVILAQVNREDRCTVVVSLHQVNVALKYCARTVALHQGRVVYDGPSAALTPTLLRELYGAEADDILALGDHISSLQDPKAAAPHLAWSAPLASLPALAQAA